MSYKPSVNFYMPVSQRYNNLDLTACTAPEDKKLTSEASEVHVAGPVHYRKTSNISRTLVGNKIVDHSDVVGAPPVGVAPTTSSFST